MDSDRHPHRMTGDDDPADVLALIRAAFAGMEGRIDPPSSMHLLTPDAIALQNETGEVWLIGRPPSFSDSATACFIASRS